MSEGESIFGTDGVRDRAGEGALAPDRVRRLVHALVRVLADPRPYRDELPAGRGTTAFIGRDTRSSGPALLEVVAGELHAAGWDVADLGILPTPGVAYSASTSPECGIAIVLSASHNPAEYNGIKLIAPMGAKISPEFERAVSDEYHRLKASGASPRRAGDISDRSVEMKERYRDFLVASVWRPERFAGKRIVLDAAHGAAFEVAPAVFRALGAEVETIGTDPNGRNINDGCGALYPQELARRVRTDGANLGFSFDGDADRMIPVTGAGTVLDGDFVLALAGRGYSSRDLLPKRTIVATVMSNIGLEKALDREGLSLLRTPVGDRHVYLELRDSGHPFGGEQSGHLIFMDTLPTGDGILAALRLVDVLESDGLDLEGEARVMTRFPQVLKNVRVLEKRSLESLPRVTDAIDAAERELGDNGRVLVRYSGTEPLARVMLEGPDEETVHRLADSICAALRRELPLPGPSS